jgi:hypothetical protein
MLTNDITLAGDASSSTTYKFANLSGGNSERRDTSLGLDKPRRLFVKHELVTRGGVKYDRHLVRLEREEPQAETLTPVVGSVHVVIDAPRSTVTVAQLQDMVTQVKNLLSAANVTLLLNNEP